MQNPSLLEGGILFWSLVFLYFVPLIIAQLRRHPNRTPIALVNVLLGWTFVGWVAALVWSAMRIHPDEYDYEVDVDEQPPMKACHYCAEEIRAEAVRCRFCGSDIAGDRAANDAPSRRAKG